MGIYQVLEAYKAAKTRFSVNTLIATLKKLGLCLPLPPSDRVLHGRVGYEEEQGPERLLKKGTSLDFYLAHGIKVS